MLKVYKSINNDLKFLDEPLVTSQRYNKNNVKDSNIKFGEILKKEQNKLENIVNNCLQTDKKMI